MRRLALIAVPYAWLLLFFLIPFAIVFKISLSDIALAIPPYTPVFDLAEGWATFKNKFGQLDWDNYTWLMGDALYYKAYISSVKIAFVSTILTVLVGYPIAQAMAKAPKYWQPTLLMLIILPFWTSFLIRIYAWIGILSTEGYLNQFLINIGLISDPLAILNTNIAVYIGVVYTYLPFMVLPIYSTLEKMDPSLLEAAEDLGCSRREAFWRITLPLSRPGIIAGSMLVFIPVVGEFVIPSILGGSNTLMIGRVLWDEFQANRDWPVASAVAIILLLILVIPIVLFQRSRENAT